MIRRGSANRDNIVSRGSRQDDRKLFNLLSKSATRHHALKPRLYKLDESKDEVTEGGA